VLYRYRKRERERARKVIVITKDYKEEKEKFNVQD